MHLFVDKINEGRASEFETDPLVFGEFTARKGDKRHHNSILWNTITGIT